MQGLSEGGEKPLREKGYVTGQSPPHSRHFKPE